MATQSVDRLAALPQELRDLIFAPLIPTTLEIKIVSVPAVHRKGIKTCIHLTAVNGAAFRTAVSLAATSTYYEQQVHAAIEAKTALALDLALDADVTNRLPAATTPRPIPDYIVAGPRKLKLRDTYHLSNTTHDQYVILHQFTITLCRTEPYGAKFEDLDIPYYGSLPSTPPLADEITEKMLNAQVDAKRPIIQSILTHSGCFTAKLVQKLGQSCVLDGRVVGWRAVDGRVYGAEETTVQERRYAKSRIRGSLPLVTALGREREVWLET
ncbi:hypothetical protein Tdes44962_MAKER09792 [Teratosphaeria destructans]|uniref:Uncharacterized protein n=1 Tax=Teratosphaeria destructans TaxID=418781 RepID=A0A9W7SR54_9PEZI|nr:hypothetical protein Tdes44962_MAKER09792 [Teratosphaeria destructans]